MTDLMETFRAERRDAQDELADALLQVVISALESDDPEAALDAVIEAFTEAYDGDLGAFQELNPFPEGAIERLREQAGAILENSTEDSDPELVALALSVLVTNAATLALAEVSGNDVVWTTMRDDDVRKTHRTTHGQRRSPGEEFDVAGVGMSYPGQPVPELDRWLNCRCFLRMVPSNPEAATQTVTASNEEHTSTVIVALPAADQPIHEIGPQQKHATLAFLGEIESFDGIQQALEEMAPWTQPFRAGVERLELLGDDDPQAEVVLLSTGDSDIQLLRNEVVSQDAVREPYEAIKQWPRFTPHVTLGYGDEVSDEDREKAGELSEILFDRLAIWHGDTQIEFRLGEDMTEQTMEKPAEAATDQQLSWYGVLAPEGVRSGDGRMFAEDSLRARDLPLPLTWQKVSSSGHDGSVVVGSIEWLERREDGVHAGGRLFDTPEAMEVRTLIDEFGKHWISVDADDVAEGAVEIDEASGLIKFNDARVMGGTLVAHPAFQEAFIQIGEDPEREVTDEGEEPADMAISEEPWDGDASRFSLQEWCDSALIHLESGCTEKGEHKLPIREPNGDLSRAGVHAAAARINQTDAPAEQIESAKRALRAAYRELDEEPPEVIRSAVMSLVASGDPATRPRDEYFDDPKLSAPTAVEIEEPDEFGFRRTFGHVAEFGECHISFPGNCVTAPSKGDYSMYFLMGTVDTDTGVRPVGSLTAETGHAGELLSAREAAAHYDNTGAAWAWVNVGEDEFGIWFSGIVNPDADESLVRKVKASGQVSGDWRTVKGEYVMVGALSVNTPGFPQPRFGLRGGEQVSLVAAGVVPRTEEESSSVTIKALAQEVVKEMAAAANRKQKMDSLRASLSTEE